MFSYRNRGAILAGILVTAVAAIALFLFPLVGPVDRIKIAIFQLTGEWLRGDPFVNLRILGGIPGGVVTGLLVRDIFGRRTRSTGTKYGAVVGIVGLAAAYVLAVVFAVTIGLPPPAIALLPLVVLQAPFFFVGGALGGFIGTWLRLEVAGDGVTIESS